MPSENQTLQPVSERELRYSRLWDVFRKYEMFLHEDERTQLDGDLWALADKVTYNDEGA